MKSSQTFLPEHAVLSAVPGVFYETEQEYIITVLGEKGLPFNRVADIGKTLASCTEDVFERLYSIIHKDNGMDPKRLEEAVRAFADEYFHQNPHRSEFVTEILEVLNEGLNFNPARHLEQVFTKWWLNDRGDIEEGAHSMIEWLNHQFETGLPVVRILADPPEKMSDDELGDLVWEQLNPQEDRDEILSIIENRYVATPSGQRFYEESGRSSEALIESILDVTGINVEELLHSWQHSETRIQGGGNPAFDAELGTDAFGVYLPFHVFGFSKNTPWGIYIFLEPLVAWTVDLWETTGKIHSLNDLFALLFRTTYRHEMFHYHVERHAFLLEVANRKPHYRSYVEGIKQSVANTEKWLEEALAQAVVLESTFVTNRSALDRKEVTTILRKEFLKFGPGYRDFDCKWTGGVAKAHRRLGTQIARGKDVTDVDEWVTNLAIPKTQYASDFKAVPGYFTFSPTVKSRFQFQTPRSKDVRRFWERRGGQIDNSRASSHENWHIDGRKVQFVDRNGYADLNSFKDMAKLLGVSLFDLKQKIRNS